MNLRTPLPEALDKLSILTLKLERLPDDTNRPMIQREWDFYTKVAESYRADGVVYKDVWLAELIDINGRCWDLEAAIRQGRDAALGLEEVGRRTILLRDMNKERIAIKNKIAEETGMDFFEIKVNHASGH